MASVRKREALGPYLESLYDRYHRAEYLSGDPLLFLHRYTDREDIEVVALVAALLAYGRVGGILASVERVLEVLGPRPADAIRRLDVSSGSTPFDRFVHRWSRGEDIAGLLTMIRRTLEVHGSLESAFLERYRMGSPTGIRDGLSGFTHTLFSMHKGRTTRARGLIFLIPHPSNGSACKRLNLFLRWMVRRNDGLDRGLWTRVSPADLIMPLDTHVARISRNLGLSTRRTADWKMAAEVTGALRRIDPDDPTRFDFALCRLGILDECPSRTDLERCAVCELRPVCHLHRAMASRTRAPGASR